MKISPSEKKIGNLIFSLRLELTLLLVALKWKWEFSFWGQHSFTMKSNPDRLPSQNGPRVKANKISALKKHQEWIKLCCYTLGNWMLWEKESIQWKEKKV